MFKHPMSSFIPSVIRYNVISKKHEEMAGLVLRSDLICMNAKNYWLVFEKSRGKILQNSDKGASATQCEYHGILLSQSL